MTHASDTWSDDDLDLLVFKRGKERKKWSVIASEMNRPLGTCFHRYNKIMQESEPAPSIVPEPKPRKLSLHEELGIKTFVHRQAILFDPHGSKGRNWERTDAHWYRYNVTLARIA